MNSKSFLWLLVGGLSVLALALAFKQFGIPKLGEPVPGTAWVEPSTGMQFVWVPSGCFDMGSNTGDDDQRPAHRVCVKGFWLGKYEVTQAEYEQVVGSNPCTTKCPRFVGPDRAVTNVHWDEAQKMAEAFSRRSGNRFRLPSESEWEYACLAGGRHKVYCGDGQVEELGWVDRWRYGPNSNHPQPGGRKKPNAWGLFDMTGNVTEHVGDCWHGNYNGAPSDGSAWIADGYCYARVYRGGGWKMSDTIKATTRRHRERDSESDPDGFGFRLVKMP